MSKTLAQHTAEVSPLLPPEIHGRMDDIAKYLPAISGDDALWYLVVQVFYAGRMYQQKLTNEAIDNYKPP